MKWYHHLAAFFAGAFLANAVPHFVNGISGNPFPTPFADPPGVGPSTPVLNVLWALVNLLIGYFLLRGSRLKPENKWHMIVFNIGIALMRIMLANHYSTKFLMD